MFALYKEHSPICQSHHSKCVFNKTRAIAELTEQISGFELTLSVVTLSVLACPMLDYFRKLPLETAKWFPLFNEEPNEEKRHCTCCGLYYKYRVVWSELFVHSLSIL